MNTIIDAATLGEFLQALFGDQRRGTLFLSGGHRQGERIPDWRDTPYDVARTALAKIAIDALRRGATEEAYFSCALFAGTKRAEAQAIAYPFLYADVDRGTISPQIGVPTILLESSPGRRQAFWKLHKAVEREIATDLNRRVAAACSADMSGWDSTQVLRLPGLPNHKYPGVVSRVETFTGRTYDVEDFRHLPPPKHVIPATITLAGGADSMAAWKGAYPYLSRKMRAVASGDDSAYGNDSSRADHAFMCALISAGLTPDEALAAFDITPRGQALALRKGDDRVSYLLELSVRKAVSLVGQVTQ